MIPRSTRSNISRVVRVGVSDGLGVNEALGVGEKSGIVISGDCVAVASSRNVGRGVWVPKIWLSWASAVALMEGVAEGSTLEHAAVRNTITAAAGMTFLKRFTSPHNG